MPIGLEEHLITPAQWNDDQSWRSVMPEHVVEELDNAGPGRQPIGLGKHPEKGWFVMCAGQGPLVVWSEWGHTGDPYG
jgi:hypothetical protein